jgi:hypothetical protein
MEKKIKHITVRLTSSQFRSLAQAIIDDEISKSQKIRELIQDYLESQYKRRR